MAGMNAVEGPFVLYTEAYWLSPWDCACWVALREKRLDFSRSVAILPGGAILEELRAHTLLTRIPVLQHGQQFLPGSVAIIEYLEEAFPPPRWPALLPAAVADRATARHVSLLTRVELGALRRERPAWMIFYPATPPPLGAEARRDADDLVAAVERLLAGPFLFGDFTIADVDVAFALQRLHRTGEELPASVAAYIDRVWARRSVAEYVDHPRPPNRPADDKNTYR